MNFYGRAFICRRPAKTAAQQQPVAASDGSGGADGEAKLPLPPCVLAHRAKHGPPAYQLSYRLQAVETAL